MLFGLIILIQKIAISQKCTVFENDTLEIFSTKDEIIQMSYSEIFTNKEYTNVTIDDVHQVLSEIQPVQFLEQQLYDSTNTQSIAWLKNDLSYEWLNKFVALEKKNNYYVISLSLDSNQGQNGRIPSFSRTSSKINADICFDAVLLKADIIAVDCMNTETNGGIQNILYLWDDNQQLLTQVENENIKGYTSKVKRKCYSSNRQIYRATLYDSLYPEYDSLLEIFSIEGALEFYLDTNVMQQLINIEYQLQILDFQVSNLGQIAILNENGDVLILNYSKRESIWKLLHQFQHEEKVNAFDFNFKTGTYVVHSGNSLGYESKAESYVYYLPSVTSVFLSQSMILAKTMNQIYLFDQTLNFIFAFPIENTNFIVNDNTKDDILVFSTDKIKRYYLDSHYYLRYYTQQLDTSRRISYVNQIIPNGTLCKLTIYHQVITTHSEVIMISEIHQNIISDVIRTYPANNFLSLNNQLVFGSNLVFQFSEIKNTEASLKISSKTYDSYALVKGNDKELNLLKLIQSEGSTFFLIKQYSDNQLEVKLCTGEFSCRLQIETQLQFSLNQQNSCFWAGSNGLYFAFVQEKIIQINYLKNQTYNPLFEIPNEKVVEQLSYNGELLILFSKEEMILQTFYVSSVGYLEQYTINSETLSYLGIKNWQPKSIYTIDNYSYLYVINQDGTELIIISCTLVEFKIVQVMKFSAVIENVLIFKNYFAVLINNALTLYEIRQEANIHFLKNIPLFGYRIKQIMSHSSEGWIYINTEDSKLLVVNINKININSLWYVQPNYKSNPVSSLDNILYLEDTIYNFFSQLQIMSHANIYSDQLIYKAQMKVKICNLNNEIIFNSNQIVQNSQTTIRFNNDNLSLGKILDQKKQEKYCQDITNGWLQNTVLELSIECPDCGKEITLVGNLFMQNSQFINTGIDFRNINSTLMVILYSRFIVVLEKENNRTVQTAKLTNYDCEKILYSDSTIILFSCRVGTDYQFISQWKITEHFGYFPEPFQLVIEKDIEALQIFGVWLFLIFPGNVKFYQSNSTYSSLAQFQKLHTFDLNGQFLAVHQIEKLFHLYTYNNQLSIVEFEVKEEQFIIIQEFSINLHELITSSGYSESTNSWKKLFILNFTSSQNNISSEYLFISPNGLHYGIQINFFCDEKCEIRQMKIQHILQNYGDWVYVDAKQLENWILILYQKEEHQLLSIYSLNDSGSPTNTAITLIAGLQYQSDDLIQFNFIENDGNILLQCPDQIDITKFSQYEVRLKQQLCMDGKIEKQNIKFIAKNDFSAAEQIVLIDIKYNYYQFWGIWLFLAVIIIGIIIGIFWWRKRKLNKATPQLLLQE